MAGIELTLYSDHSVGGGLGRTRSPSGAKSQGQVKSGFGKSYLC